MNRSRRTPSLSPAASAMLTAFGQKLDRINDRSARKPGQSARRTKVSMRDHLKDNFGIVTNHDLYAFIKRNTIKGKQESNYDIMVRTMGEQVADKVMRQLEIQSWF